MNSLLAKINRKRQYYAEGLAKVLYIAQLLEHAQSPVKPGYEPTVPKIQFKDGLPDDELEMANLDEHTDRWKTDPVAENSTDEAR